MVSEWEAGLKWQLVCGAGLKWQRMGGGFEMAASLRGGLLAMGPRLAGSSAAICRRWSRDESRLYDVGLLAMGAERKAYGPCFRCIATRAGLAAGAELGMGGALAP
jgi:hypothetical protein